MKLAGLVIATLAACGAAAPAPTAQTTATAQPTPESTTSAPEPARPQTALQSRPFSKKTVYVMRVKRTIEQQWNPSSVWLALPQPRRAVLGTSARQTVLELDLAVDGTLTRLEVHTSSGSTELDGEAIRAVQVSSPFGALPDGEPLVAWRFAFLFEVEGAKKSLRTVL